MSYVLEWSKRSEKQLAKLDRAVARSVVRFMHERVHQHANPRHIGKQLRDSPYRRYRVGGYRILCLIEDEKLLVLVVELGHRREVYR